MRWYGSLAASQWNKAPEAEQSKTTTWVQVACSGCFLFLGRVFPILRILVSRGKQLRFSYLDRTAAAIQEGQARENLRHLKTFVGLVLGGLWRQRSAAMSIVTRSRYASRWKTLTLSILSILSTSLQLPFAKALPFLSESLLQPRTGKAHTGEPMDAFLLEDLFL